MSSPQPHSPYDSGSFDSRDTKIVIIDGPGNTTVGPASPKQMRWLLADCERLTRLLKLMEEEPLSTEKPSEDGKTNGTRRTSNSQDIKISIVDEGPGDAAVRPASPERKRWLWAERERLARLMKLLE